MYYVLMTDVVRVPSPNLEKSRQYLFGISVTGCLAPGVPVGAAPPPPNPSPADGALQTCVNDLANAGASGPAIATQLGPIAPWTWALFDEVMLTDGVTILQVPTVSAQNLDSASFSKVLDAITAHLGYYANNADTSFTVNSFQRPGTSVQANSTTFFYHAFVSALGAAPAPLPHSQMNLVRFFTVTETQLATLAKATTNKVVAIPLFTINENTVPPSSLAFAGTSPSVAGNYVPDLPNNAAYWLYGQTFNAFKVVAHAN